MLATNDKCALKGCKNKAEPDIQLRLAEQKFVSFCCWDHLRSWAGWEKPGDREKTDAEMY